MKKEVTIILSILYIIFVSGCAKTYSIEIHKPLADSQNKNIKQLAIFLDGTENDRDSRTNISALNEIIKHQNRDNLYLFYNEGVGTDGRVIGAGTGWGNGKDVAEAYAFLTQYYSKNSKLSIFGFSRGAYSSRILNGMIYSVGIYKIEDENLSFNDRYEISKELYSVYKNNSSIEDIKYQTKSIIEEWKKSRNNIKITSYDKVSINILGIWDTVEALGDIPTKEAITEKVFGKKDPLDIVSPNRRYIDQICNIDNIFHVLSLDDNRAKVFTPIIITAKYNQKYCDQVNLKKKNIQEVWFSGAHSDVGGGYEKTEGNTDNNFKDKDISLPGISLNWMIKEIKKVESELLPKDAFVYSNSLGYIHDAQNNSSKYARHTRESILKKYSSLSKIKKIHLHESVLDRLKLTDKEREKLGYDAKWYDGFKDCFDKSSNGSMTYKKCNKIKIIKR